MRDTDLIDSNPKNTENDNVEEATTETTFNPDKTWIEARE
jgi:hypothetical protein